LKDKSTLFIVYKPSKVNTRCTLQKQAGYSFTVPVIRTRVYPKVSGLAAWSENC